MPYKNPDEQREYQRLRMARIRSEYLAEKCCVQCGSTEKLEIDHIDRTAKIDHKVWSWSVERRLGELSKCQVLCKECHRQKTVAELTTRQHGSRAMYQKEKCRCALCKACKQLDNSKRVRHRGEAV